MNQLIMNIANAIVSGDEKRPAPQEQLRCCKISHIFTASEAELANEIRPGFKT